MEILEIKYMKWKKTLFEVTLKIEMSEIISDKYRMCHIVLTKTRKVKIAMWKLWIIKWAELSMKAFWYWHK